MCKVAECDRKEIIKGYCAKHYHHIQRHGEIIKRTTYDPNEAVYFGNEIIVILYDSNGHAIDIMITDKESYKKIEGLKICLAKNGYAVTRRNGKVEHIHRIILNVRPGMYVDHINGNKLDNRLSNLRECTNSQNNMNKPSLGIIFDKRRAKWVAYIVANKTRHYLGQYEKKEDAITSRRKAEKKYFGEYAYNYEEKADA